MAVESFLRESVDPLLRNLRQWFLQHQLSDGSWKDSLTGIVDYRPVGEIATGLLFLGELGAADRGFQWLIQNQNDDGSWNEKMADGFNEENCLSTAIIGRGFVLAFVKTKKKHYLQAAQRALSFVLSQEFRPGYFLKAVQHYSDILNVDAACAAFISSLSLVDDKHSLEPVVQRTLLNIVRQQFKDGAFPYAGSERLFPYEEHLNVRDLYYHSLTIYYLSRIYGKDRARFLELSLNKAYGWLNKTLGKHGARWSQSKVIFTIGSAGFYAAAASCFSQSSETTRALRCIQHLVRMNRLDGLLPRYEPCSFREFLSGIFGELFEFNAIAPTNYSVGTRFFRIKRRVSQEFRTQRKRSDSLFYTANIFSILAETFSRP